MGYYLTKLKETELHEYFGRVTMNSIANNGAFDKDVSEDLMKYFHEDEHQNIFAIVDADGIEHFLNILKSGNCRGRNIELLINTVSEKYMNGFMVRG